MANGDDTDTNAPPERTGYMQADPPPPNPALERFRPLMAGIPPLQDLVQRYRPPPQQLSSPQEVPQPQQPSMQLPPGLAGGFQPILQDLVQRFFPQYQPQQQEQPWRSPYRMVNPRDISQIGTDWWPINSASNYLGGDAGPMMPSPLESLHVMGGAGRWLQQFASPGVGQYYGRASQLAMQLAPMLDMMSQGKFSRNYWAARSGRLKDMQEEMLLNTEMGLQRHQEELGKYREIMDAFNLGGIDEDEANRRLEELAQTDPLKLATLKNKGIKALGTLLTEEDRRFRDMAAGYTSTKKAREAAGSESAFEDSGTGEGTTTRAETRHPDVSPTPRTDTTADTGELTTDQKKVEDQIRKDHNLGNPNAMEDARRLFRGEISYKKDLVPKYGDKGAGAIDGAANQMRRMVDDVGNKPMDPSKSADENRDERLKQVEAIDPDRGTLLRRLTDYEMSPKDFSIKDNIRTQVEQQAMRIDPTYKPRLFDRINKLTTDSRDPDHQTLLNGAQLNEQSYQVLKALEPFKEGPTIPQRQLAELIANRYTGDDKYSRLYSAINQYTMAAARFSGGGNQVRQGLFNHMIKLMSSSNSPAQIRAQLQVDNGDAWSRVDAITGDLKSQTGRDIKMPGYVTAPGEGMDAIRKMTSATGEMPDSAPDRFKAVGKKPSAGDRPDWRTPKDEESPLTTQEGTNMLQAIEENKNNPAMAAKVQELRKILAQHGWY